MRRFLLAGGVAVLTILTAGLLAFHPSRPLYIKTRPVAITSGDGTVLAGTLSLPRWRRAPAPALVIVHGSGPLTRDHLFGDVRRFVWAGIAVLAYDKRGTGASQGTYAQDWGAGAEGTLRRLAGDAAAAIEQLRREPGIDTARTGFFGASQAGWIIPLAAAQVTPPPRFHILISGPAVATGVEEFYSRLTGDGIRPPRLTDAAAIKDSVTVYVGYRGYDPAPLLRASHVPTLWLLGELDESVPTYASVRVLDSIWATGNHSHTVVVYPDANHGLHDVMSGEPAPLWLDMFAWLRAHGAID